MKAVYNYKCVDCGADIQLSYVTHLRLNKTGRSPRCKKCNYIKRGKDKKEWYRNLPQEEKDRLAEINSKSHKKFYNSLSDEKKKEMQNNMKSIQNNFTEKLSDKEREELKLKRKKGLLKYLNNMTEEERNKRNKISIMNLQKVFDNKDAYKEIWAESARNRYNNMTDEQKQEFMERIWEGHNKWYNNLSEEEKKEFNYNTLLKRSSWYSSLSDEQKQNLRNKIKESWSRLSEEERSDRIRNTLINAQGDNKFHKKFWNSFQNSQLSNNFYLVPETVLFYNDGDIKFNKSWDYGIYSKDNNNKLVMVVDLDGSFIHADNSDYNGLHSKEEYDERRFLSVPEGIKYHIINDFEFSKSFEIMIKLLMMNYDKFIEEQFRICRMLPDLPYPTYNQEELIKSWMQLSKLNCSDDYHTSVSINNREGDRLINHFHHSIYGAKRKGSISPFDAWYNDELLLKVIKNRMIYINNINTNKILQGFNISKIAPKVSVFSAGRAKLLINKYLYNMNEIFDPFSGFSGRMLGTISLNKRYIGQDISEIHVRESNNILEFLSRIGIERDVYLQQQNILHSYGEYQSLFTCPPYSDKEQWLEVPIYKRTCDDWITECLNRFKCKKYLFVVDDTSKYKNRIVEEIQNKFHFNTSREYVILI